MIDREDMDFLMPEIAEGVEEPKYRMSQRARVEEGVIQEFINTIELPFEEYLDLERRANYNQGFTFGMQDALEKIERIVKGMSEKGAKAK